MMYSVELETIAADVMDMKQRAAEYGRENKLKWGFGYMFYATTQKRRPDAMLRPLLREATSPAPALGPT